MRVIRFEHESTLRTPVERLRDIHSSPDALPRLMPGFLRVKLVDPGAGVTEGSIVTAEVGPFRSRWTALHAAVTDSGFADIALSSPFPAWIHQHWFIPISDGCLLRDVIWYLPPRWLPRALARFAVNPLLRLLFGWRHRRTARLAGTASRRGSSRALRLVAGL